MTSTDVSTADLRIEVIDNPKDLEAAYELPCLCFGEQTKDGVWMHFNPGWDTSEGKAAAVERLYQRFSKVTKDKEGRPNTIFLKASVQAGPNGQNEIVGYAIWCQLSMVEGYGDRPSFFEDAESIYPGNTKEQRYAIQLDRSVFALRREAVKEKESASPPALFVLDLCVVKPEFQGRGIAKKLVQWGLDEAQRRGRLECAMEASVMGRHVYSKLGFQNMGQIQFVVDEEFVSRERPDHIWMRTGNVRAG